MKRKTIIIFVVIIVGTFLTLVILGKRRTPEEKMQGPPLTGMPSEEKTEKLPLAEMSFEQLLKSGVPVLAEFGHNRCIPCRQMAPILEEITKEYTDKLIVKTIDVYEHNNLAMRYRIRLIPTQIFFDSCGNEFYRHEGFFEKNLIIQKLIESGIK